MIPKYNIVVPGFRALNGVDGPSALSPGTTVPSFNALMFNLTGYNSLTSDALLRTKAEQEWERESQTAFTTEYFSIDIAKLESAIACVPVYQQLGLSKENLSVSSMIKHLTSHVLSKCRVTIPPVKDVQ